MKEIIMKLSYKSVTEHLYIYSLKFSLIYVIYRHSMIKMDKNEHWESKETEMSIQQYLLKFN